LVGFNQLKEKNSFFGSKSKTVLIAVFFCNVMKLDSKSILENNLEFNHENGDMNLKEGDNMSNKKIEIKISRETDKIIRKNGKIGESYDELLMRMASHAYVCDIFCNQE